MMTSDSRRLMIIEPPFYRLYKSNYSLDKYPLALAYLCRAARRDTDWQVRTYNADFSPDSEPMKVTHLAGAGFQQYIHKLNHLDDPIWHEVRQAIAEYRPDVVGITSKTQNFKSAANVARIVKSLNPDTTVILGGPHASMAPGEALEQCANIDIAVRGEGEVTLIEILKNIEQHQPVHGIPGTVTRNTGVPADDARHALPVLGRNEPDAGQFIDGGTRPYIDNLDMLTFPHEYAAECLKDFHRYPKSAFQYIFATRACPYNCYFCGSRIIWGRKTRWRSAQNVAQEFLALRKFGLNHVHFDDDTFGVKKSYILELCDYLKRYAPGMTWSSEMHVKIVTPEIISAMADAGCTGIQLGVESGSNWMLKEIRKNIRIEEAYQAAELIRKHGIFLSTFFIIGFPRETEQTLADTVDAMKKIKADRLIYSIFTPYPGTETFNDCRSLGLVDEHFDSAMFNHQSPENCFTAYIPKARFRQLAGRIEPMIDRRNRRNRVSRFIRIGAPQRIKRAARKITGFDKITIAIDPPRVMTQETDDTTNRRNAA